MAMGVAFLGKSVGMVSATTLYYALQDLGLPAWLLALLLVEQAFRQPRPWIEWG